VRRVLTKFEFFAPNIYWTTYKCGLTMWHGDGGKLDVATFSFDKDQRSTLISIACAELLATRSMWKHVESNMKFTVSFCEHTRKLGKWTVYYIDLLLWEFKHVLARSKPWSLIKPRL
jgi:hypothetical protein